MFIKKAALGRAGRRAVAVILSALLTAIPFASASAQVSDSSDLAYMSLEDLLSMEITTLSRKAEDLADAPAAVHVISQSDIQRSGARSIPDLLRMVPGMQVAQIDSNKWAVTARGTNGQFANKLLVLMDGRNVYSPLASGVFWNEQDTDIANIERIEVIRGPGATMWGANAVNGVVNIITKNAVDTVGGDVSILGSDQGSMEGTFRYGAGDEAFAYRIFAKVTSLDPNVDLLGNEAGDSFEMVRVGGRADWAFDDGDTLVFTADAYSGEVGSTAIVNTLSPPFVSIANQTRDTVGGHALARWSTDLENGSNLQLQGYVSYADRFFQGINTERLTLDLDLQQSIALGDRHNLMWGFGYRSSWDELQTIDPLFASVDDPKKDYRLISAFIQDDFSVTENFRIMFGTKIENSNFSPENIEVEPSARFSYRFNETHSMWGAASRAIRLPSRGEQDGSFVSAVVPPGDPSLPLPVPTLVTASSSGGMISEEVFAIEFGYRFRSGNLLIDVATFYNDYDKLRSADVAAAPICQPGGQILPFDPTCVATATYVELPVLINNISFSETAGVEVAASTQVTDWWSLHGVYTYFDEVSWGNDAGNSASFFLEDSPENQFSLRSNMDVSEDLQLDVWLRHAGAYEAQGIDEYTAVDVRVAWQPSESIEVSAVGRNLGAGTHTEFVSELNEVVPVQIEPEGYIEVRWGF
ncbi:MAG: TonB-dependent receptor [Woeseiaceae bacterium]|nr:TonB-dependent receptor [Woeseiaceae bacterium]